MGHPHWWEEKGEAPGKHADFRRRSISDFIHSPSLLIGIPLAAILVPAVLTWVKDLNPSAWRMRQLDEQFKLVSFWDNWAKAVSSTLPRVHHKSDTEEIISSLLYEARTELAEAGKNVLHLYRKSEIRDYREFRLNFEEFQQYRASLSWPRRAFLLYKSPNRRAKIAKVNFYWNVLAPFCIASIELPLLKYTRLRQYPPPSFLVGLMASSRVFHVLFVASAFTYWIASSLFYRSRSIRFENDPALYLTR
jgi:hypothetical protein